MLVLVKITLSNNEPFNVGEIFHNNLTTILVNPFYSLSMNFEGRSRATRALKKPFHCVWHYLNSNFLELGGFEEMTSSL